MSETLVLSIAIIVFIVTNMLLKNFWKGSAEKIYKKALEEHTSVSAECVKTWISRNNRDTRADDVHRATYQYIVNGKKYKKDMDYTAGPVIFYYDKKNPKRAVTKDMVNSADHAFARIIVSLVVAIIVVNLLV